MKAEIEGLFKQLDQTFKTIRDKLVKLYPVGTTVKFMSLDGKKELTGTVQHVKIFNTGTIRIKVDNRIHDVFYKRIVD